MKIKFTDGSEHETDNMRDYQALYLEKFNEFKEFCCKNQIYIWAFTVDNEGNGSGFYNMPDSPDMRLKFLTNIDDKLKESTKGAICLKFNKIEER